MAVDTREQAPYTDTVAWRGVKWERMMVEPGDYGIVEAINLVAYERKSEADYWSCMGSRRFRSQVDRLGKIRYSGVVIEADPRVVFAPEYRRWIPAHGKIPGKWSRYTGPVAFSITREHMFRTGMPFWFAGDRETAATHLLKMLDDAWEWIKADWRREARDKRAAMAGTSQADTR